MVGVVLALLAGHPPPAHAQVVYWGWNAPDPATVTDVQMKIAQGIVCDVNRESGWGFGGDWVTLPRASDNRLADSLLVPLPGFELGSPFTGYLRFVSGDVQSVPAGPVISVVRPESCSERANQSRPECAQPPGLASRCARSADSETPVERGPLKLSLWTDRPGYRTGDRLRLFRTQDPKGDRDEGFVEFFYLERVESGDRRYFAPRIGSQALREEVVDSRGRPMGAFRAARLEEVERELIWEGAAPEPGLWHFVAELHGNGAKAEPRRAYAKFVVASKGQVLNRPGFVREVSGNLALRSDTIHYLGDQLIVNDGATLTIEAGTLVEAWSPRAAIIVERGGRIVAEGTREAPVVLTCTLAPPQRQPGCWGGVRVLGAAPVTRQEGIASDVLPADRATYGGTDAGDSSGSLRYVRVEFAGSGPVPGTPVPAMGLYGVGSGTVLEHVQVHASLGDGLALSGGTAACDYCVVSGSGGAGLAWKRGWRGAARHLYVQHGERGTDGVRGANDAEGWDQEPRSRPTLSNVTLVHSHRYGRRARKAVGLRLNTGSGVLARSLLVTGFGGGAIEAGSRSALLFEHGESAVENAILYWNRGTRRADQVRGLSESVVDFLVDDPKLRNVRYEANPDPRPKIGSPALLIVGTGASEDGEPSPEKRYIGAFGEENWLEEWTFFGAEPDYDVQVSEE